MTNGRDRAARAPARIEVVHKGRFAPIPEARAEKVGPNAWEIAIPAGAPIFALTRRAPTAEAWDGAVFSIDGVEAEPATGSGEDAGAVRVVALVFPT